MEVQHVFWTETRAANFEFAYAERLHLVVCAQPRRLQLGVLGFASLRDDYQHVRRSLLSNSRRARR